MAYTIRPICNGSCKVNGYYTLYQGNREALFSFPLLVWLIEGGPGPILVDTGLADVARMNRDAGHVLAEPIVQLPEEEIRVQLNRLGLTADDISMVILTHLHFDHVDQLSLFSNARIVVSRRGLERARAASPSWAPEETLDLLTRTGADRVIALDDEAVMPGIEVAWMGGHTPCSQAVYVETKAGEFALAGDAVFRADQLESQIPIGIYSDLDEARGAIAKLRDRGATVLPSHDPMVFEQYPSGLIGV